MKIKITNSEPKLISFWDIYGKELDVKDTKEVNFASGTKKYYIVEFDGRDYEVPEDMIEGYEGTAARGKKVGGIGFIPMDVEEDAAIVARWNNITVGDVLPFYDALIDAGITDDDLRAVSQKKRDKEITEIWTRAEKYYNGERTGNFYFSVIGKIIHLDNMGNNILAAYKPFKRFQTAKHGKQIKPSDMKNKPTPLTFEEWREEDKQGGAHKLPYNQYNDYLKLFNQEHNIINQYEDHAPATVWKLWNLNQREHFLKDHFDEINKEGNSDGIQYSTFIGLQTKERGSDYEELPNCIKRVFRNHLKEGQYAKGGKIPNQMKNNYYYLKIGNIIKEPKFNNSLRIVSLGRDGMKVADHSKIMKNNKEEDLDYETFVSYMNFGDITIEGCAYETDRDKILLQMEIDNIKSSFEKDEIKDSVKKAIEEVTIQKIGKSGKAAKASKELKEKTTAFKDTIEGVEAVTSKPKKRAELINQLMEESQDAYMRSSYGDAAWRVAIEHLIDFGYTEEDALWILMSKYMRWADDEFGHGKGKRKNSGHEVMQYHSKYGFKDDNGKQIPTYPTQAKETFGKAAKGKMVGDSSAEKRLRDKANTIIYDWPHVGYKNGKVIYNEDEFNGSNEVISSWSEFSKGNKGVIFGVNNGEEPNIELSEKQMDEIIAFKKSNNEDIAAKGKMVGGNYKRGDQFWDEVGNEYSYYSFDSKLETHLLNDLKNNGNLVSFDNPNKQLLLHNPTPTSKMLIGKAKKGAKVPVLKEWLVEDEDGKRRVVASKNKPVVGKSYPSFETGRDVEVTKVIGKPGSPLKASKGIKVKGKPKRGTTTLSERNYMKTHKKEFNALKDAYPDLTFKQLISKHKKAK